MAHPRPSLRTLKGFLNSGLTWIGFTALLIWFIHQERESFSLQHEPVHSGDEGVFWRQSQHSVLDWNFYTAGRPFTVPLLYKLAHNDEAAICRFQSRLSVVCWFWFSLTVALSFKFFLLRIVAAAAFCLFSLTVPVNQWDYVSRSESLCLSLLVLSAALTVTLARRLARRKKLSYSFVLWWALIALLAVSTRDSMAYLYLSGSLGFLGWFLVSAFRRLAKPNSRGLPWRALLYALVLGGVFGFSTWTTRESEGRWRTPLHNVLVGRVLSDARIHQMWIDELGFPENPKILSLRGKWAWTAVPPYVNADNAIRRDPELADLNTWMVEESYTAYQKYLWLDRGHAVRAAHQAIPAIVNDHLAEFGKGAGKTDRTETITRWMYWDIERPVALGAMILALSVLLALAFQKGRILALLTFFLVSNAWSQAFITYHGDAFDVHRHMFTSAILFRLGLIAATLMALHALGSILKECATALIARYGSNREPHRTSAVNPQRGELGEVSVEEKRGGGGQASDEGIAGRNGEAGITKFASPVALTPRSW